MRARNILFTLTLSILIGSGCTSGEQNESTTDRESLPLTFDTFSGIPRPLQGCACFFARSNEAFEDRQYLFANDYNTSGDGTGMAFMEVRNRVRQFTRTSLEGNNEEGTVTTYESDGYTLKVSSNFGESLPGEAVRTTGTLTLTGPDGESISTEYIGTCAC